MSELFGQDDEAASSHAQVPNKTFHQFATHLDHVLIHRRRKLEASVLEDGVGHAGVYLDVGSKAVLLAKVLNNLQRLFDGGHSPVTLP